MTAGQLCLLLCGWCAAEKIPPFLPVPVKPDDAAEVWNREKILCWKAIYFELDRDETDARSYVELCAASDYAQNPKLKIEIIGHRLVWSRWLQPDLPNAAPNQWSNIFTDNKISCPRLQSKGEGERKTHCHQWNWCWQGHRTKRGFSGLLINRNHLQIPIIPFNFI